jgi:hypothetical protein
MVRSLIATMTARELEGVTPFPVHEQLVDHFVKNWEPLCLKFFESVEFLLEKKVESLCVEGFNRFQSSGLLLQVRQISIISIS